MEQTQKSSNAVYYFFDFTYRKYTKNNTLIESIAIYIQNEQYVVVSDVFFRRVKFRAFLKFINNVINKCDLGVQLLPMNTIVCPVL